MAAFRHQARAHLAASMIVTLLVLGACTSISEQSTGVEPKADASQPASQTVDDACDALLSRLIAEALPQVGSRGLPDDSVFGSDIVVIKLDGDPDVTTTRERALLSNGISAPTGLSFSSLMDGARQPDARQSDARQPDAGAKREAAVQQPDIIKTDGERLVVLTDAALQVLDITQTQPALLHNIDLGATSLDREMFMIGDSAIVISNSWLDNTDIDGRGIEAWREGEWVSRIVEVDLKDASIGEAFTVQGAYLSALAVDDSIRMVFNSPTGRLPFAISRDESTQEQSKDVNKRLVENSTIDDWIPSYTDTSGMTRRLTPCDQVYVPAEIFGFRALSIVTLDVSEHSNIEHSISVVGDGDVSFPSADQVVVTSASPSNMSTQVNTFDITNPVETTHLTSESFDGIDNDQHSGSNPPNPTVLGELDAFGYSGYLHPIGDLQIIGIGRESNERGQLLGSQVSVYDVEELANPTIKDSMSFGLANYSSVELDPKSFTWWAPTRTAFVPVAKQDFEPDILATRDSSSSVVLGVSVEGDITELGRISHPADSYCGEDLVPIEQFTAQDVDPATTFLFAGCHFAVPNIRRTLVVGDTVYTVSDRGVQANTLNDLATIDWVEFDVGSQQQPS